MAAGLEKLIGNLSLDPEPTEKPEQFLETVDIDGIANFIKKSEKCKNIITMCGAGISTSAGIPDFRSPDTGLYANLQKYDLPNPTAIFELDYFKENPEPFFKLSKELWPGIFKPTPSHYFIKLLNEKGLLLRAYTQNIDTLERVSGLPGDKIIEAHGTFHTGHCISCRAEYTQDWMKEKIFKDEIPKCTADECDSLVKPDIVFFGEPLPMHFFKTVQEDLPKCDLLIVMGTSLAVQPFASLVSRVPETTPRIYINRDKGAPVDPFMALLGMGTGFDFDSKDNYRDVFLEGNCDDGCQKLADALGWGDEFKKLVKAEHEKIDAEATKVGAEPGLSKKKGAISGSPRKPRKK